MTFSEKLCALNALHPLCAEDFGISGQTLKRYLKGQSVPRPAQIWRMAEVLQVSVYYLLHEDCADPLTELTAESCIRRVDRVLGGKWAAVFAESIGYGRCRAGQDSDRDVIVQALCDAFVDVHRARRDLYGSKAA